MNIEEIKMDHFENFEELIKTCKMWIGDDDIDAYYRFFEFNCMKTLVTVYEKEKEKREKLQYEATEAEEYIKELKKYIEKNKIRIPMPEKYQNPEDWGKEVTIQTKDYISKDEYEKLLNGYNKRVKEILKLEQKIEDLENGDLTTVYMSGFYDGEKKWKDKIKKEIEGLKEIKNPLVYRMNDTDFINGIEYAKQILQRILHGGEKE